jgi:O-acetyl-ADP-ribose deacetylase (regulator of RNase III)
MIKIVTGNIFTTRCQTIVNTVNCVGVMGKGIAYEFRLRYPEMFTKYKSLCENQQFDIGMLWIYKSADKWVLNFPTKYHWKNPSKQEYIIQGLEKFVGSYAQKGIESIAFPLLGASNGGLSESVSISIMCEYLERCDIPVEIYKYDPTAYDDLYIKFKSIWQAIPEHQLARQSRLRIDFVRKISHALNDENTRTLNQLLYSPGIGEATLEKSFQFIRQITSKHSTGLPTLEE